MICTRHAHLNKLEGVRHRTTKTIPDIKENPYQVKFKWVLYVHDTIEKKIHEEEDEEEEDEEEEEEEEEDKEEEDDNEEEVTWSRRDVYVPVIIYQ